MVTLGAWGMRWLGAFPAAPVAVSAPTRVPN
jgi:hypothetical protein